MISKSVRFSNLAPQERNEVAYATIPFKKGEWSGEPLEVRTEKDELVADAWIYPFGKKYKDGSYRYGALLARVKVPARSQTSLKILTPSSTLVEPVFKFSSELTQSKPFVIVVSLMKQGMQPIHVGMDSWDPIEQNGMRQVHQCVKRFDDFVANMKVYFYNDQNLSRWELDITGSNPENTLRTYSFNEIRLQILGLGEDHYLNIRNASRRGVSVIDPFKQFRLMKGSQGLFGDGQKQSWYGELITRSQNPESSYTAAAAVAFEMWGMSQDWSDSQEALGAMGVLPKPPVAIPANGLVGAYNKYLASWRFMTGLEGNPWDDYPDGLTKTPSQTGSQIDFGIIKGWDVLYSGLGELIEVYRFLATEDAKRPGHYLEKDGSHVKAANHPNWVVWDGVTHYNFGVSPDRLGKTDPSQPISTNGWLGKDWQHFSSNILYLASLLTGSFQLRDEQNHEAEIFIAGQTLPSLLPGWSTNYRGEGREFGRPYLALLHHDTIIDRHDVVDRMMKRFDEVVKTQWLGATRSPVHNWVKSNDPRYFPNGQDSWCPWNEHLGWIGMLALYLETQDAEVKDVLIKWADTLIKWGWRVTTNGASLGHAVKWYDSGQAITPIQFSNTNFWIPVSGFNQEWGLAVAAAVKDSDLFDPDDKDKAQQIFDYMSKQRLVNYNVLNPFDTFGEWVAIPTI